jgi:hypothetical protein
MCQRWRRPWAVTKAPQRPSPSPTQAMQLRPPTRVALLVVPAIVIVAGCRRQAQPEPPAAPVLATVRIESLLREHPAYPTLRHVAAAAPSEAPTAPVQESDEKPEASSGRRDSKMKASDTAPVLPSPHEREIGNIEGDAQALEQEHERLRAAATVSVEDAAPVAGPERPPPPGVASDASAPRRQLASVLRRETVAACRYIASSRGIRLELPPGAPEDAADMTESFRAWLRAHWQEARQPEGVSR